MADKSVLHPSSLAHVVFRTSNLKAMVDFWASFLGAERTFESEALAFLSYDEEHHRIAIIAEDGLAPPAPGSTGMHHVAFSYETLAALLAAYRHRLGQGMKPTWSVNHGPTTSIYYKDPDGNNIETQVDNFDTVDETNDFMMSSSFVENPIGTDIDPEDLIARLDAGVSEKVLRKRVDIGARTNIPVVV